MEQTSCEISLLYPVIQSKIQGSYLTLFNERYAKFQPISSILVNMYICIVLLILLYLTFSCRIY